jgi:hypothetical protein
MCKDGERKGGVVVGLSRAEKAQEKFDKRQLALLNSQRDDDFWRIYRCTHNLYGEPRPFGSEV